MERDSWSAYSSKASQARTNTAMHRAQTTLLSCLFFFEVADLVIAADLDLLVVGVPTLGLHHILALKRRLGPTVAWNAFFAFHGGVGNEAALRSVHFYATRRCLCCR